MSLGYNGVARKYSEDDKHVIYEYSVENWNEPYRHRGHLFDGLIVIDKSTLVEPEIHEKLKRMPSGRKRMITKKIIVLVDVWSLIETGQITVYNSSRTWRYIGKIDYYANALCHKIYQNYQENGVLPEIEGFTV